MTRIAGCCIAEALTISFGVLVDEVLIVMVPYAFAAELTQVTANSNSFPGRTVFNSALKAALVDTGGSSETKSSRLLVMRTTLVSFVASPSIAMKETNAGCTSSGCTIVAPRCNRGVACTGSLQVTVATFVTGPLK